MHELPPPNRVAARAGAAALPLRSTWCGYTLANDAVYDSALALFESLSVFAPGLEVRVIPYDDRQERFESLMSSCGLDYFAPAALAELERAGREAYPESDFAARGFRKLAAFLGPAERFFFFDTDVVALTPLVELAAAIETSGADLVHFDTDLDQVYRQGPLRDRLVREAGARGFNAGLFAGRSGVLAPGKLAALVGEMGTDWRAELVPNAEQPFFNLYADRFGLAKAYAHELVPDACSTCWPAVGRLEFDGRAFRLRDSGRWDEGWRFLLAHWAGYPYGPSMPNRWLFDLFHDRDRTRTGALSVPRF